MVKQRLITVIEFLQKYILVAGLVVLVLILMLLWQGSRWVYQGTLDGLTAVGNERMTLYTGTLRSALEHYAYLPYVLSTNQQVIKLLQGEQHAAEVNILLEELDDEAGSEALYVMNDLGTTLASSNWREPLSFVGHNYGFRPYFAKAKGGARGSYFAIGATTGRPGYFMSHPVRQGQKVIGVAAVKVDLTDLQEEWRDGGETVLVSDVNGVFFLSSYHSWRYRTLEPLTEEQRIMIQATRQYGHQPLDLLPLEGVDVLADGQRIVNLEQTRYLMMSRSLHDLDWQIHYLLPLEPARERAQAVLIIGFILVLLTVALAMYARERRQKLISRRTARQARALVEMNQRLQQEIAQHNQTEKALREAQAELVQSGKLAALGHMAAGIVHELNQPIAAIRTHAASGRLLLERHDTNKLRSTFDAIARMTEHLGSITVQLKTFAHKAPAVQKSVVLQDCIAEVLTMTAPVIAEADVIVNKNIPAEPLPVAADCVRVNQVLVNLIRNAVDAMRERPVRHLQVDLRNEGEVIRLIVADTGTGISAEDREEIFTPFFTTKDVGEGLGLGLSITYRIVNDLGGTIAVGNNDDGGATFIVTLPAKRNDCSDND
ncbi:MAG: ATP-binding protein [Pelovirga sp.]